MKKIDLLKDNTGKLFFKYLIPSISATLVSSIYVIVDTIMVGRGVGADALVALNLLLPLFSLLFAFGSILGVGGSVIFSVSRGAENDEQAQAAFSTALCAAVTIGIIATITLIINFDKVLSILGVEQSNYELAAQYGVYVATFGSVYIFSTFLQTFVRNDKSPKRAMVAVLTGAILNIIIDAVLIFKFNMGMAGAAIATIIGTFATVCILLTHFISKQNTIKFKVKAFSIKMLLKILSCGMPSFLMDCAPGIIIFAFNNQLLRYLNTDAIVVYSIIANCAIVCTSLFNGIAQAAQPIMAVNYGASAKERVKAVAKLAIATASVLGVLLTSTAYIMPDMLINMFVVPTESVYALALPTIRLYFLAFVPMGVNIFLTTYFQSVVRSISSLVVSVLRGVALPLGFLIVLPMINPNLIWLSITLTEGITCIVAVAQMKIIAKGNL